MTARFVVGATALYAQLASVLRSRILNGEWASGTTLPSLDALCTSYGLGRVTVRQALLILAGEGLVSSQRGRRTCVTYSQPLPGTAPLFTSIRTLDKQAPDYSIRVLSRKRVQVLPPDRWQVGVDDGPYVHIRKVDHEGGRPYAVSSIHLAEDVYKRLPKGAEGMAKLAQLAVRHAKPSIGSAKERLSVAAADFEAATALEYPMAAPVARAERVFFDTRDRVIYCGVSLYRGDRFRLERELTEYLRKPA